MKSCREEIASNHKIYLPFFLLYALNNSLVCACIFFFINPVQPGVYPFHPDACWAHRHKLKQ